MPGRILRSSPRLVRSRVAAVCIPVWRRNRLTRRLPWTGLSGCRLLNILRLSGLLILIILLRVGGLLRGLSVLIIGRILRLLGHTCRISLRFLALGIRSRRRLRGLLLRCPGTAGRTKFGAFLHLCSAVYTKLHGFLLYRIRFNSSLWQSKYSCRKPYHFQIRLFPRRKASRSPC